MASFSIFDSFLFLSLATTFVLIILLFYHFKERLSNIEKKCETLFHISQNLADQLANQARSIPSTKIDNKIIEVDNDTLKVSNENLEEMVFNENIESDEFDMINEIDESDGEEGSDEEESDGEEGSDGEEESDDEVNEEDIETFTENTNIEKINIPSIDNKDVYKKMTVSELRQLVITKGLSTQPGKMKKNELIELLDNN